MIDNIRQKIVYQMLLKRRGGNLPTSFSVREIIASVTRLCPTCQLSAEHRVTSASGCCAVKCHPADKAVPSAWRRSQCQPCFGMKWKNSPDITHYFSVTTLKYWLGLNNLTGTEKTGIPDSPSLDCERINTNQTCRAFQKPLPRGLPVAISTLTQFTCLCLLKGFVPSLEKEVSSLKFHASANTMTMVPLFTN